MRTVLTILSKEFKSYFLSPIAYVFITVYIMLTNFLFFQNFFLDGVSSMRAYFEILPWLLLVFIPAVTMRCWSEEKKNKSLELLLTWPVKDGEVVAGKFLAALGFYAFTLLLSISVPITIAILGNPDMGVIVGSYIGSLLLGACYIAIGMWISSLTENQIIAFIGTIVTIVLFLMIGTGVVTNFIPESWVNLFAYLGLTTHFESISRGVIDSRDIIYYGSLIFFFLFLNIQSLESRKWEFRIPFWWAGITLILPPIIAKRLPFYKKNIAGKKNYAYVFMLIIFGYVIIANYMGTKYFTRIDITETEQFTLSDITREKLSSLEDDMTIDLFYSSNQPPVYKKLQGRCEDVIKEFQRHSKGKIKLEWHDPVLDEDAYALALSRKVHKDTLGKDPGSKLEPFIIFRGLSVTYRGKVSSLPVIKSDRSLENELVRVMFNTTQDTRPTIGILKTDSITPIPADVIEKYGFQQSPFLTTERYAPLFNTLAKSYTIRYFDLSKGTGIPADLTTLVIPGGNDDYWNNELYLRELDKFIYNGGNIILFAPRVDINIKARADVAIKNSKLFEMLAHYGITTEVGLVLDEQCDYMGTQQGGKPLKYPYFPYMTKEGINREHETTKNLAGLIMQWSSPVITREDSTNDLVFDTLVLTTENSFVKEPPLMLAPNQKWDRIFARARRHNKAIGRKPIAVAATGKFKRFFTDLDDVDTTQENDSTTNERPESRLVLLGSDNFITPDGVAANNMIFVLNLADWLTTDNSLISIRTKNIIDRSLPKWEINELKSIIRATRLWNIFTAPLLIILLGLIVFILRHLIQKKAEEEQHGNW